MTTEQPTINLKDIWRIQYSNGTVIDPIYFMQLNEFGMAMIEEVVCLWKVKGYKTLIMLGTTTLIPE